MGPGAGMIERGHIFTLHNYHRGSRSRRRRRQRCVIHHSKNAQCGGWRFENYSAPVQNGCDTFKWEALLSAQSHHGPIFVGAVSKSMCQGEFQTVAVSRRGSLILTVCKWSRNVLARRVLRLLATAWYQTTEKQVRKEFCCYTEFVTDVLSGRASGQSPRC